MLTDRWEDHKPLDSPRDNDWRRDGSAARPDPQLVDDLNRRNRRMRRETHYQRSYLSSEWAIFIGLVVALSMILWFIIWAFFSTTPQELTVGSTRWERIVPVEEWVQDDDSSTRRSRIPDDAYNISSKEVYVGDICITRNSEGWCTFSIPQYQTKWYWMVDIWKVEGPPLVASGVNEETPGDWPYLEPNHPITYGATRSAPKGRHEVYSLVVIGDGKERQMTVDREAWDQFQAGDPIVIDVTRSGRMSNPRVPEADS